MTRKKQKQLPNGQSSKKKRHVIKILAGILFIALGLCCNWDITAPADVPRWIDSGPYIIISAEELWANIDVGCHVWENGNFVLSLSAGERLYEPVRIWVTVMDIYYPFHWEISDGVIDNVSLRYAHYGEEVASDYPIERTFISQKTDRTSGESKEHMSEWLYSEVFTAVITPGEESCEIKFQMEPDHTEYRIGGDVIIRMPSITNARDMPAYNMNVSDLDAIIESGDDNILSYFSNGVIDGTVLFETTLNINGNYYSEYMLDSNYVMTSIQPNPVLMSPSYIWRESLQWVPYIVFHDFGYDKCSFIFNWIGGILITVGSGLLVLPLSDWIQPREKSTG